MYQSLYEQDREVPDDMIIESPGGASTSHHHYSGGLYGGGRSHTDKFAGQGNRYDYGEYGNLYKSGHSSAEEMGIYEEQPSDDNLFKESFEEIGTNQIIPDQKKTLNVVQIINLLIVIILLYTITNFSAIAFMQYLQKSYGGRRLTYSEILMYVGLLSIVVIGILYNTNLPFDKI